MNLQAMAPRQNKINAYKCLFKTTCCHKVSECECGRVPHGCAYTTNCLLQPRLNYEVSSQLWTQTYLTYSFVH